MVRREGGRAGPAAALARSSSITCPLADPPHGPTQRVWTPNRPIAHNRLAAKLLRPGRPASFRNPGGSPMPLEQSVKSALRDKVSTANKSNVDAVADEVNAALAGLDPDDKDHARLQGWLEDLSVVKGGGVPGKF